MQSLSRASKQVDIFVAICQLTLYLGMISLVLPLIGAMIGYGLAIELGYIMQIISIFMIYLFQICGLVLSNVTEFPRTDYVMLLLALAIGAVTYFTTGSIGTACLIIGILSILFTFRNYLLHVATLHSLPMRVRYSFNALMSGSPIYYPGKIGNVLDHIFETIHRSAREVGTAESIALTYRLADHVLTTIQNLRSTLRMIGLASLGLMIGIVTCMHWMLTATAGLGITMKYTELGLTFAKPAIMSIDKLLALALAVNCFLSGEKIMDNEHLGMHLQTIAGVISLTILHIWMNKTYKSSINFNKGYNILVKDSLYLSSRN
ncbi:MAG: hypothetical protein GXO43_03315 [Crenarchaeota archaeon]|nr:hypothetical protein [Thermoproteota archaeon]